MPLYFLSLGMALEWLRREYADFATLLDSISNEENQ